MATTKQSLARRMLPPRAKKGETYAGIIFKKGKPKYHLFKGAKESDGLDFDAAKAFADKEGASANRDDLRMMDISIPHKFKTDKPYWSNEECAGHGHAWAHWFRHGNQGHWYKSSPSRVCVVRRVPI
jgi:hypothetical protein